MQALQRLKEMDYSYLQGLQTARAVSSGVIENALPGTPRPVNIENIQKTL